MKLLGVNVDELGLTNEEIKHAVEVLNIRSLSEESAKLITKNIPADMKKEWFKNPDSVGELSDDGIKAMTDSMSYSVGLDDVYMTRSEIETVVKNKMMIDMDLVINQEMTDEKIEAEVENATIDELLDSCSDMDTDDINDCVWGLLSESSEAGMQAASDKSDNPDIDEAKIFSDKYAAAIEANDKKAYDLACGAFEKSIDRQVAHYDNFYTAMLNNSEYPLTTDELNRVSELVASGLYDYEREKFMGADKMKNSIFTPESVSTITKPLSDVEKYNRSKAGLDGEHKVLIATFLPGASLKQPPLDNGGKFVVSVDDDARDYGTYLQSRTSDIATAVGDDLGLPETSKQTIFITPSSESNGKNSFLVIVSDKLPEDALDIAYECIKDELRAAGADLSTVSKSENYKLLPDEFKYANDTYSNSSLGLTNAGTSAKYTLPREARQELEQAAIIAQDEYDETGHSANGDYNAMYDKGFTDNGPDF